MPLLRRSLPALLWLCTSLTLPSQTPRSPTLLTDLRTATTPPPRSSDPEPVFGEAGTAWFTATTPDSGRELWSTDGTAAGTRLFDEFDSGAYVDSFGEHLLLPDGTLVAGGWSRATGHALFARAPGAARWTLLVDPWPGHDGEPVQHLTTWGTECWFVADDGTPDVELWRSDGTPSGTRIAEDIALNFGTGSEVVTEIHGGSAGLWIMAARLDRRLWWKASPTTPSVGVSDPQGQVEAHVLWGTLAGHLVFVATSPRTGWEPWISDGSIAGTRPLVDIVPGAFQSGPQLLAVEASRIWFSASSANERNELWITDGTTAGTRMVVDLAPGRDNGIPSFGAAAVPAPGGLVFTGYQQPFGTELFFTDGTAAGTRLLLDIRPGTGGSDPRSLFAARGRTWFQATNPQFGTELWSTDGTSVGTRLELDLQPGSADGNAKVIGDSNHGLILAAEDPRHGTEPWLLDPATGAATLLANLAVDPINGGGDLHHLTRHDAFAFFVTSRNGTDFEAFVTAGTPGSTMLLPSPPVPAVDQIQPLGAVPAGVVFRVFVRFSGNELWVTDGTAAGTRHLLNLDNRFGNQAVQKPTAWRDQIWFSQSEAAGPALWRTDGTTAGTGRAPGFPNGTTFEPRLGHAGWLWGVGEDALHGREPWISDGTMAGTRRIADIWPGPGDGSPFYFTPLGDRVFVQAGHPTTGSEPWITDGTAAGTFQLAEVEPNGNAFIRETASLGDRVVFLVGNLAHGVEPWVTDGTRAGTHLLRETVPGSRHQPARNLRRAADHLLFVAYPAPNDPMIWTTDGTSAGTVTLFDAATLGAKLSSLPTPAGDSGSFVFTAVDPAHGLEPWASDGTLANTRVVADSFPGQAGSAPDRFLRFRDGLLFQADDGRTGIELHRLPLADFGAALAGPIGRGCGADIAARGAPRIGRTFTLDIHATVGGPAGLVLGSDPAFGSPRPDCEIHVAHPTALGNYTTDAGGAARLPIRVPNDPALVGTLLYLQSVHLSRGGPLFGNLELTQGLELLIGR